MERQNQHFGVCRYLVREEWVEGCLSRDVTFPRRNEGKTMRILMLGNSFTAANDLPQRLAQLTGAEVMAHTRGGARLAEQLNPKTKLGARTLAALEGEPLDFVILQEMSHGPVSSPQSFFTSVERLCEWIHAKGATPVLFTTWAYEKWQRQAGRQRLGLRGHGPAAF